MGDHRGEASRKGRLKRDGRLNGVWGGERRERRQGVSRKEKAKKL